MSTLPFIGLFVNGIVNPLRDTSDRYDQDDRKPEKKPDRSRQMRTLISALHRVELIFRHSESSFFG